LTDTLSAEAPFFVVSYRFRTKSKTISGVAKDTRFPAPGLDVRRLAVGHSDERFCFGIKDGIKPAGRNRKMLVWQRIIAGFDPSRPSQPGANLVV
jgi:hypothetical protein